MWSGPDVSVRSVVRRKTNGTLMDRRQVPAIRRADAPPAWICQARADWQAAERFGADESGTGRCHAIAKWQQTVEKAVKALVSSLHGAGILGAGIRPRHEVERYVGTLIRLPRAPGN